MANPRKFSEKIALQKQKQAEGTAEFERIMKEVHQTKMDETQVNQKILEYCLRSGGNTAPATSSNNGGSGNGVGGGGGGGVGGTTGAVNNDNLLNKSVDKQIINDNKNEEVVAVAAAAAAAVTETQLITTEGGVEATPLATGGSSPLQTIGRESRVRSVGVGPIRRPSDRKQDRSPYGSTTFTNATNVATNTNIGVNHMNNTNFYLSPPQDTNWRRSNSDSALHQSLNMAVNAEIQSGMNSMLPIGDVNNVNVVTVGQHSPHMVRRLSANQAAMRRKAVPITNMQQQQQQQQQQQMQQQQQQHNYHMLQQQQQQQQRQLQHAMQQQQHIQEQQQQQHYVTQQQQHQQQQQQQQQQQLHFNNNKFLNCNSTLSPINNSFFKTFSDQSFGSLPDLSSVHFNGSGNNTNTTTTTRAQQQQQQHQQILSPLTIDYHDQPQQQQQQQRERTPSPYIEQQHSPNFAQNTQVVTPQYTQSTTVSFGNLSTSSEMKNEPLTVCISLNQSHNAQQQQQPVEQLMRSNLPTLGAASSAGNLTEYRQPLNPPSPGSSPGLLTSASGNELHMSAPSSPIRYMQNNSSTTGGSATTNNTTMQGGSLIQTFDNVFGGNNDVLSTSAHFDNNNSYNQFHNHFEHFTLGDSNSSPDQHQQTYLDLTHDFGIDYGNMVDDDLTPDLTINELTAAAATSLTSADLNASSDATNLFNVVNDEHHNKDNDVNVLKKNQQQQQLHDDSRQHNYQQHKNKQTSYSQRKHQEQQQQQQLQSQQQQQQQRLINKIITTTTTTTKSNNYNQNTDNIINNNNNNNQLNNNETAQQQQQQHNIDTTTSNIVGLINSPTSPMPIPLPAAQSPIHQQHHAHSPHMQQQSPLHSPLTMQQQHMQQRYQQQQQQQQQNKNTAQQQQQSPHHTTATTTTTTDTSMNTIGSHHNSPMSSPLHSPASSVAYNGNSKLLNNVDLHHHHQHHQQQQQQQQHQQHNQQQQQFNQLLNDGTQTQTQTATTTTNIPSIIFSDYSSNADIFDAFDIGTLGSMDDVGLQMISEQNSIIITDPNIEDSFRRDFN